MSRWRCPGIGGPLDSHGVRQGRYDTAAHLRFVRETVAGLPAEAPTDYRRSRPCVIVLDNYAVHRGQTVTDVRQTLEAQGVRFLCLPAFSPELNAIEPL